MFLPMTLSNQNVAIIAGAFDGAVLEPRQ